MGKISEALEKSNFEVNGANEAEAANREFIVNPSPSQGGHSAFEYHKIDKNMVTISRPHGVESEQFKKLRTGILFPTTGKPPRSILVTSAVPGEGKSFVAANLAVSMAQNIDKHVLLMDCDLRLPTIHTLFGLERGPGLSEYLSGDRRLDTLFLKSMLFRLFWL